VTAKIGAVEVVGDLANPSDRIEAVSSSSNSTSFDLLDLAALLIDVALLFASS
jgi:hypothetical protein